MPETRDQKPLDLEEIKARLDALDTQAAETDLETERVLGKEEELRIDTAYLLGRASVVRERLYRIADGRR